MSGSEMSQSLLIHTAAFEQTLARYLVNSKREVEDVLRAQSKALVKKVITITPPASSQGGDTISGVKARMAGQATVRSDIRSLYGTPSDAFGVLKVKDPVAAGVFWKAYSTGQYEAASNTLRQQTGRTLSPFDGGTLHKRVKGTRRKANARQHIFYVRDPRELATYIKTIQERVGFLAAGWNEAGARLGYQSPAWIWRHDAPGSAEIRITPDGLMINMTNAVRYAAQGGDLQRRVQWAVTQQAESMQRELQKWAEKLGTNSR